MEDGAWRVSIRPSAGHEIDELVDSVRHSAIAVITDLRDDPFPPGSVLLRSYRSSIALGSIETNSGLFIRPARGRKIVIERVRRRGSA
jgi:hypothetical protein